MAHKPASPESGQGSAREVYAWVRATRKRLFDYCASLPVEVYTQERESFAWGSLRNTHVHIADCYRFWLAETAFGKRALPFRPGDYPDPASVERLFDDVDTIVADFLAAFPGSKIDERLSFKVPGEEELVIAPPLWLLAHATTHEFHHKGQMVAWGRILGHPPPETDLAVPR